MKAIPNKSDCIRNYTVDRSGLHMWIRFSGALLCGAVIIFLADITPANEPIADRERLMKRDCFGDPLPSEAVIRLGTIRLRHGVMHSVAFGPKSDFLVSGGSNDNFMRVWNAVSGEELLSFSTHDGHSEQYDTQVYAVAAGPDGDLIAGASGLEDCVVFICSLGLRKRIANFQTEDMQGVRYLAFSGDGKLLACAGHASCTFIWDITTKKLKRKLMSGRSRGVAFAPDGKTLVVASADRTVHLYDVDSGKKTRVINYDTNIESMDVSPDGRLVACLLLGKFAERSSVVLTSIPDGKKNRELSSKDRLYHVRFLPDGKAVAADGCFWNLSTGRLYRQIADCGVSVAAFSPDGKLMTFGLDVRDVATGKPLHQFPAHNGNVGFVSFLADGRVITSGLTDETVTYWDGSSGKRVAQVAAEGNPFRIVVSSDGKRLAGVGDDGSIQFYDGARGKRYAQTDKKEEENWTVDQMAFSADGATLAVACRGKRSSKTEMSATIRLLDSVSGRAVQSLRGHTDGVDCLAFEQSGRMLMSGSSDKTARLWDVGTGKQTQRLDGHRDRITSLAVAPNGKRLATGSRDDTIRLWDASTGKESDRLSGVEPAFLVFSPDSRFLVWVDSTNDSRIHFYEIEKRKEAHCLVGHRGRVTSLAFSADGMRLLSGSEDTTALVWDVPRIVKNLNRASK
jgi:WD40 repeat protein